MQKAMILRRRLPNNIKFLVFGSIVVFCWTAYNVIYVTDQKYLLAPVAAVIILINGYLLARDRAYEVIVAEDEIVIKPFSRKKSREIHVPFSLMTSIEVFRTGRPRSSEYKYGDILKINYDNDSRRVLFPTELFNQADVEYLLGELEGHGISLD